MVPTTTPEFDKKTDNRMPRKFRKVESHSKKMAVKKMYHRFEANSGLKMYAMQVADKGDRGRIPRHVLEPFHKDRENPELGAERFFDPNKDAAALRISTGKFCGY